MSSAEATPLEWGGRSPSSADCEDEALPPGLSTRRRGRTFGTAWLDRHEKRPPLPAPQLRTAITRPIAARPWRLGAGAGKVGLSPQLRGTAQREGCPGALHRCGRPRAKHGHLRPPACPEGAHRATVWPSASLGACRQSPGLTGAPRAGRRRQERVFTQPGTTANPSTCGASRKAPVEDRASVADGRRAANYRCWTRRAGVGQ